MKISIVGTGYVGLVTGACLADLCHNIVCVDVDPRKVEKINSAIPPIYENGLEALLKKHVGRKLRATSDLEAAVLGSDLTLIATGTPFDGRVIDLSYVKTAAEQIGAALKKKPGYHVVVVKSTVVPGTTDRVVLPILEAASGKKAGIDFGVGMNPEFLSEGVAVEDFAKPDRIVLGGIDARSQDVLSELYAPFDDHIPRLRTNNSTAEMIKYASNALQATAISFANEIANLCSTIGGIDALDVMAGVHAMKELSPAGADGARVRAGLANFLSPGCGFGGSCFPKDVKALIAHGAASQSPMLLLDAVLEINENQPAKIINLLKQHLGDLEGKRIAVLGLAFKPGTDDMRESPAIPIVRDLIREGSHVVAHDPIAIEEAKAVLPEAVKFETSLDAALDGAPSAVVIVTRWDEYRRLPQLLGDAAEQPLVVDARRMLEPGSVKRYVGIGLG